MSRRSMAVRMLGGFEVVVDGRETPPHLWRRQKAAALVKLLALTPGHRVPREQAMEALWPEMAPDRAGANLRKTAFLVRGILDAPGVIVLDGTAVQIGHGWQLESDVEDFEEAAGTALTDGDPIAGRDAAKRYRGELLPDDLYDDWSRPHRRRLEDLHRQVLEQGELWGRLVDIDPANERAHQAIMNRHLDNHDRAAALRQFEQLRTALRDHLGVLPNERSNALYEEALSLDAPLIRPPLPSAPAPCWRGAWSIGNGGTPTRPSAPQQRPAHWRSTPDWAASSPRQPNCSV